MSETERDRLDAQEPRPAEEEAQGTAPAPSAREAGEDIPESSEERVNELNAKIDELQAKADEWLDKYRRSVAEFSNYRKRQDRERQQQAWRVNANVLGRLLEPLDDLERALQSVPEDQADTPWVQGVALIEQKIRKILSEYGVQPVEALGEPFDPNYHEALLQEHSEEYPQGTVMAELKKGYTMDGQVLRPSLVMVSLGSDSQEEPEAG